MHGTCFCDCEFHFIKYLKCQQIWSNFLHFYQMICKAKISITKTSHLNLCCCNCIYIYIYIHVWIYVIWHMTQNILFPNNIKSSNCQWCLRIQSWMKILLGIYFFILEILLQCIICHVNYMYFIWHKISSILFLVTLSLWVDQSEVGSTVRVEFVLLRDVLVSVCCQGCREISDCNKKIGSTY